MPIVVQCPNTACNQPLQVPDQYAGMQGKCPKCGTMVQFPAAGAASAPPPPVPVPPPPPQTPAPPMPRTYAMGAPPAPPAYEPPAYQPPPPPPPTGYSPPGVGGGYAPPDQGQWPAAPAKPPMTTQQLVELITPIAGLFFLFLLFLAALLPWMYPRPEVSASGLRLGDAGIFLVLCLLLGAAGGLTYALKTTLPVVAMVAAGFGVFSFFFMLGAMLEYSGHTGAGIWIGLIATLGVGGAFTTLSLHRPLAVPEPSQTPVGMKRHAALFLSLAVGGGLGFLYLLLAILAKKPYLTGL